MENATIVFGAIIAIIFTSLICIPAERLTNFETRLSAVTYR